MVNLGFLAALGTAISWGSFMVPFKKVGTGNLFKFQFFLVSGVALSGLIASLILGFPLSLNPYALASGILWTIANTLGLLAVSNLGLAKAVPIMSSLVIVLSFLWGAVVFGEMPSALLIGFAGTGLIILGVILVSINGTGKGQNIREGIMAAVLAGVIWGSQLVPLKVGMVSTKDFFFPVCLGIFMMGLLFFLVKRQKLSMEGIGLGMFSGLIWNIGNLLSLLSVSLIGLSKAGPISQLSTLVAIGWGLFYFKEAAGRGQKIQILIGSTVLFTGIITLALA